MSDYNNNDHIFLGTNYNGEDKLPKDPRDCYQEGYDHGWGDGRYNRYGASSQIINDRL